MTEYLLDTNILSYFLTGSYPSLTARMRHAMQTQSVATSAICSAEMRYGQSLMATNDKRRRSIDLLLTELPCLPWTNKAADQYGFVKSLLKTLGTPIGELDTQIAAQALAEKLILVTHNTRHFDKVPLLTLDDWMV